MANDVVVSDTQRRKPTTGDPRGHLSILDSAAIPSISDAADSIYDYVHEKAASINKEVKKNRGLPPTASPENMLSVEEKAIIILGRAIGVVWSEIEDRIVALRHERGEKPPTTSMYRAGYRMAQSHKPIVEAIQVDMLNATEAFSPLVGGTQRFTWRATILELYRREIAAIFHKREAGETLSEDDWQKIRMLDLSMRPHLKWFDNLAMDDSPLNALTSPAAKASEQIQAEREAEIEKKFEAGEIDDSERIDMLRELRHGSEDDD